MDARESSVDALRDMRITRRRHRIADLEWFEALYRVYLAAFLGGGAVLFLSGLVSDRPLTADGLSRLTLDGPPIVGVIMAGAVFLGVRSGLNGGPISVEEAEVRHVLLAPVPRGAVLRKPFVQRLRSISFSGALVGATCAQLVQRRIPGRPSPIVVWAMWGAVAGACVGASFVVIATLVHVSRTPRWAGSLTATALLVWQLFAALPRTHVSGPFDTVGGLALWTLHPNALDLASVAVVLIAGVIAMETVDRLSIEALARRSALVSQLRFAVTLQDIRTVVVLRRQLGGEHARQQPWLRWRGLAKRNAVMGRSFAGVMRFPVRRILRMSLLTVGAAACEVMAWRGSAPMAVLSGILLFIVGLDAIEPLSQEIDQPDRTDALPVERGPLHIRLLVVPSIFLIVFLVLGTAMAVVMEPSGTTLSIALMCGPVALLAGVAGATVNVVMGAPDPLSGATSGLAMPPEVTGMTTLLRAAWPVAIASIGSLPILSARWAADNGFHVLGSALRSSLGVCIMLGLVGGWVVQRDAIKTWFRNMQTESRGAKAIGSGGGQ